MKKTFALSVLTLSMLGCGGGSSDSGGGETPVTPDSGTETLTTAISRSGYAAEGHAPAQGLTAVEVANLPIPAALTTTVSSRAAGAETMEWQRVAIDNFEYDFAETNLRREFGEEDITWTNYYHEDWSGPGATQWQEDHASVTDGNLELRVSSSNDVFNNTYLGREQMRANTACISSNYMDGSDRFKVQYPVFVEASVSMANLSLAAAVWLLTPDNTQEIDILEIYSGQRATPAEFGPVNDNAGWFAEQIHLSHHSFIRSPFTDYQPTDVGSWWKRADVNASSGSYVSWGDYSWNGGNRQYVQIGVNWVSPFHFEYYIDGELVRVVYDKAFASKTNGEWRYTYPEAPVNGSFTPGYQDVVEYAKNTDAFDFATLKAANDISETSAIDPFNYQSGQGFHKPADIIINMELQSWWNWEPSQAEQNDPNLNTMLVDWVRVYKPQDLAAE